MLSYGWIEIGVLFSTTYARKCLQFACTLHTCTKTLAPLVNCVINNALVNITPHLLQTLFQFVSVVHARLVHSPSLLDDAPDPVSNRIKVRAVRWPKIRFNERRSCLLEKWHSVASPVCWGVVMLKAEEFPWYGTSRITGSSCFESNQKSKQTISMQVMCNKTKCVQKIKFSCLHFLQDLQ